MIDVCASMTLPPLNINYNTFLKEHFILPPPSAILTQVLQVLHSKTDGANRVTELISQDVAMVSHILKVVNSAYYGLRQPIGNLQYAIVYLGLAEVSRICLALLVVNMLKPGSRKELQPFWLHSYLSALIAKRLVKEFGSIEDSEDLYAAALLHDVGQLIYQRFFPEHYREMRRFCAEKRRFLVDAEGHFNLPSHLKFGSLLCDHWGLPKSIKRACEFHELVHLKSITNKTEASLFDIVIAVSNLIAILATQELDQSLREEVVAEIQRVLGISKEDFRLLLEDVYQLKVKAEKTTVQVD